VARNGAGEGGAGEGGADEGGADECGADEGGAERGDVRGAAAYAAAPRARSGIGSLLAWTTPSGQEVSAPSGPRPTRRGHADDHAKVGRWAATVVSFRRAAGCPTMYT